MRRPDNSFETPQDPREFERILDSPTFNDVWTDMEKVLASGKVKTIGRQRQILILNRCIDHDSQV